MSIERLKAPWHLWVVAVLAILFNAIGVYDFVMFKSQGEPYLARAGMTPDQIDHYRDMPVWMTVVWGVGVFGAFLASLLLVLRMPASLPVFAVSLAAFIISLLHTYVLTDGGAIMGRQMAITSAIIAALLAFFIWYSRRMTSLGVLR